MHLETGMTTTVTCGQVCLGIQQTEVQFLKTKCFFPEMFDQKRIFFSCFYASTRFLHTYSLCSFPSRVQTGANLLPTIQSTQQDQMLVRYRRNLRWRHSSPPAQGHCDAATQPLCRAVLETSMDTLVVSQGCQQRNKEQLRTSSQGTLVSLLHTLPHILVLQPARLSWLCGSPARWNHARSDENGASGFGRRVTNQTIVAYLL